MDGHHTPPQPEGTIAVKTKSLTEAPVDIVTLLHGSSAAVGNSEAEATSRWRGTSLAGDCTLPYNQKRPDPPPDRLFDQIYWPLLLF
jgi:hypothetical protein